MKYTKLFNMLIIILVLSLLTLPTFAEKPNELKCGTAIVVDADTMQILYEKDSERRMFPASITKIMTALLVIENTKPTDILTVSFQATQIMEGSAHIGLREGEVMTIDDALYGLMLASANDMAGALGEHVSGSQEDFAKLMTQRAHELGAINTTFKNAHGLPDDAHLTTAYDMALITKEAMKYPSFVKYFGTPYYEIEPTNKLDEKRYLYNHHKMLRKELWPYSPNVIGGKTGYTTDAGNTLVTVEKRGDRTLICIVLKSTGDGKYTDSRALLDYCFDDFGRYDVVTSDIPCSVIPIMDGDVQVGEAALKLPPSLSVTIPNNTSPDLVKPQLTYPDLLLLEQHSPAYLSINLTSKSLLEIPLEYNITIYPDNTQQELILPLAQEPKDISVGSIVFAAVLAAGFTLLLSGILFILLFEKRGSKNRKG